MNSKNRLFQMMSVGCLVLLCASSAMAASGVQGWLERIDEKYIVMGAFDEADANRAVKYVISVDGKEIALEYFKGGKVLEQNREKAYSRMAFDYGKALEVISGTEFSNKSFDLKVGVQDPDKGETNWFFETNFQPSATQNLSADEYALDVESSVRREEPESGLEVWLTSKNEGRAYYRLSYTDAKGQQRSASAINLGSGLYSAFLPAYPTDGNQRTLQVVGNSASSEETPAPASSAKLVSAKSFGSWVTGAVSGAVNAIGGAVSNGANAVGGAVGDAVANVKDNNPYEDFAGFLDRDKDGKADSDNMPSDDDDDDDRTFNPNDDNTPDPHQGMPDNNFPDLHGMPVPDNNTFEPNFQ